MTATYETLIRSDDRLAASGVPPLSDWWRDTLAGWYRHPTALTLAVCAGRGSAKSTALYKVAINETLFGDFAVPPGERHYHYCRGSSALQRVVPCRLSLTVWVHSSRSDR